MQPLDLNLSSKPFRNNTPLWVGLVLSVGALVALSVWNVRTYRERTELLVDLRQQQVRLQEEHGVLSRRDLTARREVEKFDVELLHVKADKANEVIRWKAFSWTRLFNMLQEVQPYDVQMTSVYPVFRLESAQRSARDITADGRIPVTVEGVAKTLKDFFAFERALVADPHFDRVDPVGTQSANNTGETVFNLRFLYDPTVGMYPEPEATEPAQEGAGEDTQAEADAKPTPGEGEAVAPGQDGPATDPEPSVEEETPAAANAGVAAMTPPAGAAVPRREREGS